MSRKIREKFSFSKLYFILVNLGAQIYKSSMFIVFNGCTKLNYFENNILFYLLWWLYFC